MLVKYLLFSSVSFFLSSIPIILVSILKFSASLDFIYMLLHPYHLSDSQKKQTTSCFVFPKRDLRGWRSQWKMKTTCPSLRREWRPSETGHLRHLFVAGVAVAQRAIIEGLLDALRDGPGTWGFLGISWGKFKERSWGYLCWDKLGLGVFYDVFYGMNGWSVKWVI